jgi:hypothetical protein
MSNVSGGIDLKDVLLLLGQKELELYFLRKQVEELENQSKLPPSKE